MLVLLKSLKEYKKTSLAAVLFAVLEAGFEILIPLCMSAVIDRGIEKGDMSTVLRYGFAILVFAAAQLFAGVFSAQLAAKASAGFCANLRQDMYDNVRTFSFSNIDKFSVSSIVTRLTTDVTNVQNAAQMILRISVRGPVMIIFSMIVSFGINRDIAFMFLLVIPVLAIGLILVIKAVNPIFTRVFATYDKLNEAVEENVKGMRVVKSYNRESYETEKFKKISGAVYKDFAKGERLIALNSPLMQFCMYACMIVISWAGAKAIAESGNNPASGLTTGELTALFTYATQILMSLMMLSMVFAMITISSSSTKRIAELLREKADIVNPEAPVTEVKNGDIEYINVDFAYSKDAEKKVINNASIKISSGETIGIIGGTGSGKTSFVQLIPRLYDVTGGELKVGGVNVRDYDLETLRNSVSMVLQKNELFSGTVRENLLWGNENASEKEIEEALKAACAADFVQAMPKGVDTYIEQGGANVSGGQKQRLCIARALLKKPKILILDDSTSAVDTKTDASIQKSFKNLLPETTKIIIAQRVSSVMNADRIIVFDDGRISAVGSHEELLKTSEIYGEVYSSQQKAGGERRRSRMKDKMNVKADAKMKETIIRIFSYMKEYKLKIVFVLVCVVVSSGASVASSLFMQTLIDDYILPIAGMDEPVFTALFRALCIMAVIYLSGVIGTWLYNRTMVTVAQGILKTIRDEMFEKMQSLPIKYFDTHTHGDIMSKYTNDTDTLRQMIAQTMPQLFSSVCTIAAVFICMLCQSVYLTGIVLLSMFFIMKAVRGITQKSGGCFVSQQKYLGELDGYVEEMINGQKVVKVFCYEDRASENFRRKNGKWREASANANSYANSVMPVMNASGYIQYVIIAAVGAWLAITGAPNLSIVGMNTMTLGMIASFLTLSRNFINPISQLSNQFNSVVMALAGAERIFELTDEEPETDDGYVTLVNAKEENGKLTETKERTGLWAWKHPHKDGTLTYTRVRGDIVLDHVDFGYTPERQALKDITLYAKPGQKIAFVGATGAGKTTVTNLINRFYDIADGKIRYDGININKIKKADLRRSMGIVLQDVNLFTGTVMENIRYGNPEATDEDCISAAKLANAHNFIMMLPKGYDTVLEGNGSGLSQGQRQLISIARAAAADPPVMILDEATSSIDTRTEDIVQKGMDRLMEGRTVFVIAHRLSTVMNSDVIMVLDHGRIAERGTHDSLIEKGGIYYRLYTGAVELE